MQPNLKRTLGSLKKYKIVFDGERWRGTTPTIPVKHRLVPLYSMHRRKRCCGRLMKILPGLRVLVWIPEMGCKWFQLLWYEDSKCDGWRIERKQARMLSDDISGGLFGDRHM